MDSQLINATSTCIFFARFILVTERRKCLIKCWQCGQNCARVCPYALCVNYHRMDVQRMSDNKDMLISTAPNFLHIFLILFLPCKCYLVTFLNIYPSASFFSLHYISDTMPLFFLRVQLFLFLSNHWSVCLSDITQ